MPGYKDTKDALRGRLEEILRMDAATKLYIDYPEVKPKSSHLDDLLACLAEIRFKREFGYDYNTDCRPPDSHGSAKTFNGLCSISDLSSANQQTSSYIDSTFLSSPDLPLWLKRLVKAHLVTVVNSLVKSDEQNTWKNSGYAQHFDAADYSEDSWKFSSVLLYAQAYLEDNPSKAPVYVFYYTGLYYRVASETAKITAGLQSKAFNSAKSLVNAKHIQNEDELREVLGNYASSLFKIRFNYDSGSNPYDHLAGAKPPIAAREQLLCYFQGADQSFVLDAYIQDVIFPGLSVIPSDIQEAVLKDLQDLFRATLHTGGSQSWSVRFMDNVYEPNYPTLAPARLNGILLYWSDAKVVPVEQQMDKHVGTNRHPALIRVSYVYFLGVRLRALKTFSLVPSLVAEDLFTTLCNSIPNKTEIAKGDLSLLKKYVGSYAREKFYTAFKFQFGTDPPQKVEGTRVKTTDRFFEFNANTSESEIRNKLSNELFAPGSTYFTHDRDDIFDNIVDDIAYRAGSQTVKDPNYWNNVAISSHYTYTAKDGRIMTVTKYIVYTFSFGKMVEDGEGGGAVLRFYINCLMMFCLTSITSGDDDDDSDDSDRM